MKHFLVIIIFVFFEVTVNAQQNLDSLKKLFVTEQTDSIRYRICRAIYDQYEETNRDSALYYANQSLEISRNNHKKLNEAYSLDNIAYQLTGLGKFADALQDLFEAFNIVENKKNADDKTWQIFSSFVPKSFDGSMYRLLMLCYTHHIFGILMWQTDNNDQAIVHFSEARKISSEIGHDVRQMMADMNLGRSYFVINKFDSAIQLEKEAEQFAFKTHFTKYLGSIYNVMALIYKNENDEIREKQFFHLAMQKSQEDNNLSSLSANYYFITNYFLSHQEKDSALYYAMKDLKLIKQLGPITGLSVNIGTVYENIYLCYKLGGPHDSLFKYQGLTLTTKDSLYNLRIKSLTDFQNVSLKEQLRLQNVEKEKVVYQNKVRTYFMLAGIAVLLLLAIIFYRNNRQKHKAKLKIEKAYSDLKSTQQQLIQSEKMASLGELTAGIAHEIQNPLNFVNNFSEVNNELIEELKSQKSKLKTEEQDEILNDIFQNNEKISFHGKRADAIVKGMLQHSRSSSGQKELTDINTLCDEYLRLSYHGLRAKDKSFNAKFETDFDPSIPKINVVPQEIGRVILNLINNAFYAASQPSKGGLSNSDGNKIPTVWVSTRKDRNKVLISVRDNGPGIPNAIKEKIFQPFFTTKPTGQGTGLGLSLSYDIITKGHGGEIKVNTKENEGTEFTIILPA